MIIGFPRPPRGRVCKAPGRGNFFLKISRAQPGAGGRNTKMDNDYEFEEQPAIVVTIKTGIFIIMTVMIYDYFVSFVYEMFF